MALFGYRRGLAVDLSGGSYCELECDGIIRVLAAEDLRVDLLELDARLIVTKIEGKQSGWSFWMNRFVRSGD
jgi:hypothetical protein